MGVVEALLEEIFEGKPSPLLGDFEGWVRDSRRFKTFAGEYRAKIRAKLKQARDEAGMLDLRAELETALTLLKEERFTIENEKYAALKQRSPDFTVTYKTHTSFNVEVRRVRRMELDEGEVRDDSARIGKLMAVLCDKVGQMPPSIVNVLWLVGDGELLEADVTRAAITLRELAERKVEDMFTRRGFASAADFLKQYRQMSAIVLRQEKSCRIWVNPLARHKLPNEIGNALGRL